MLVNRRTFVAKRGCRDKAAALLQGQKETGVAPGAIRIYVPAIAPFDHVVAELEFEDWEQYQGFWAEWDPGEAFWEQWYALTESGGSNEVWRLFE